MSTITKKIAGRVAPNFMGNYDNSTIYRRLDWVYYGGSAPPSFRPYNKS